MPNEMLQILQLITTTILTLCSVSIAFVGSIITYRQYNGLQPIAIVTQHGIIGGGSLKEHYCATVSVDLWNRRKYPIRVERISFAFYETRFNEFADGFKTGDGWVINSTGVVIFHKKTMIDPTGHHTFEMKAPFKKRSLDDLEDFIRISIDYFDPTKSKQTSIVIVHYYQVGPLTGGVKKIKY